MPSSLVAFLKNRRMGVLGWAEGVEGVEGGVGRGSPSPPPAAGSAMVVFTWRAGGRGLFFGVLLLLLLDLAPTKKKLKRSSRELKEKKWTLCKHHEL
jgi:hypothetical protein